MAIKMPRTRRPKYVVKLGIWIASRSILWITIIAWKTRHVYVQTVGLNNKTLSLTQLSHRQSKASVTL